MECDVKGYCSGSGLNVCEEKSISLVLLLLPNYSLTLNFPNTGTVLKKAGGQKLLQIHSMLKKQKEKKANMKVSEILEKIHNNLQKEREMTTVIQNVFQVMCCTF